MWLAETDNLLPKGIFILIAIAFWAIGTAVKSIKAQRDQQQARERFARLQNLPVLTPVQGSQAPSPARRGNTVRRQPPVPAHQPQRLAQAAKRPAPPPVPTPELTRGSLVGRSGGKTSPARVANATASSVRQWLRPETLRAQFILSELFQPPKALRPPDDRLM